MKKKIWENKNDRMKIASQKGTNKMRREESEKSRHERVSLARNGK